jgi:PAS domain S-box-containing protein
MTATPRLRWHFVLPLLFLTLSIGAAAAVGYRYLSADIRHETQRTLTVIAEQKRQQIEDRLAQTRSDAELYFSGSSQLRTLFGQWLDSGRQDAALLARMQTRMEDLARVRGWGGLTILDAVGRPVLAVGVTHTSGHEALIQEVLRQPRIETVDLHRNADGRVEYGVLAPIGRAEGGGAAPGVVYLSWRAEQDLYPLVASWPVPTRTAETYLVRREGDRVRFLTPLRFQPDAALELTQAVDSADLTVSRAVQGQLGLLANTLDYRGVPVLAYVTPIAGMPWFMVAEMDRREADAGIRATAWATALIMGLGLLLIYTAGYLLWHRDRERRELAALQARQAAELQFRTIFEQAPIGVALVEVQTGCLAHCNDRFAKIVGRSRDEASKLSRILLTHPDDRSSDHDQIARLNAGEISSYRVTKRYLRPDGSLVWVDLTAAALAEESGQPRHYLALVEDITERKEAEDRLHCITEAAHDAILMMNPLGIISYWNPAATKILGYSAAEALGHDLHDLLAPSRYLDGYHAAFPDFQRTGRGAVMGKTLEWVARHQDGRELAVELSLSAIALKDGWNAVGMGYYATSPNANRCWSRWPRPRRPPSAPMPRNHCSWPT